MLDLRAMGNMYDSGSLSNRMRAQRFAIFARLIENLPKPVRMIDFGGTADFWRQTGWIGRDDVSITAVNISGDTGKEQNYEVVVGDATNLEAYSENQFDVAFSNSVIEHLFTGEAQFKMAAEVRRVASAHWVQTPNFWFPMEPHFHVPGWQWLPRSVRIAILRKRRCGWRGPCPDVSQAEALVDEVKLMKKSQIRRAFPDSEIWCEKYLGLTKSFVAYSGFGCSIEEIMQDVKDSRAAKTVDASFPLGQVARNA